MNLLYLTTKEFGQIDVHLETVSNAEMGIVLEELIRTFAKLTNETVMEHFTPQGVIRLMVIQLDRAHRWCRAQFNGATASGKSKIHQFVLKDECLEAIMSLHNDMKYNTGIST